ncbi:MAG: hypothetical protein U9P90_03845 [Patescibacteria group bacterium]|nr:hypothetical protein [Patescibacteria group bacterium]
MIFEFQVVKGINSFRLAGTRAVKKGETVRTGMVGPGEPTPGQLKEINTGGILKPGFRQERGSNFIPRAVRRR